jgi:dTDP-glucose 4,6-dehydratase
MNKKKILCTGTGGFILSNFVRKAIYENKPYEFVSIDKITQSSVLNNIYANKNHTFHIGDVADEHFINVIFELEKPNIVIHAAAETHVDNSLKNPNNFIHSNVLGTQVMVNAAVKWGVEKFIYLSTDEVYGQLKDATEPVWTENSPINPRNPYSASKAAGELIVKAASSSYGLNYCITRSSNNFGQRQTPDKFIPKVIKCILENKKIPVYGQGAQIRDWLYVSDNCSAIMKIIESGENNAIYNISAQQEYSNIEVVNEITKIMNNGFNLIEFVDERLGHDFRYGMDASKIKKLGWEPKFKFKDGLTNGIQWYLNNKWFLK